MTKNFLLSKEVNDSLFKSGIAIPVAAQDFLSLSLSGGRLRHGEKSTIKIFVDGKVFDAKLQSNDFDREKYPTNKDIWRILHWAGSPLRKKIREVFTGRKIFTLHASDMKDVFCLEAGAAFDELTLENLLELSTLTDAQSELVERFGLTKYRKVNREVGERLKREYRYRCQICGLDVGLFFGAHVCDCHHINYFSVSLDNAASNLLIVCPNHHRIIHAAQPTFDRERKLLRYPNGLEEILRLNAHL